MATAANQARWANKARDRGRVRVEAWLPADVAAELDRIATERGLGGRGDAIAALVRRTARARPKDPTQEPARRLPVEPGRLRYRRIENRRRPGEPAYEVLLDGGPFVRVWREGRRWVGFRSGRVSTTELDEPTRNALLRRFLAHAGIR